MGTDTSNTTPLSDAYTSLMPPGNEIREGYVEAGDVTLHYVEAGEGPLVILLHGFPEFWFGWRQQIAPLAAAERPARRVRRPPSTTGRRRRPCRSTNTA